MRQLQTSTLTNQNIASALAVATYTATATRGLFITICVNQITGGGLYQAYFTRQKGGAGTAYPSAISAEFVPVAVTAHLFNSDEIAVDSGDVIVVYVIGQATDTTTPDIITDIYENDYIRPTVAGRTLDVTATGAAGIDWANVENPTTAVDLSATTINPAPIADAVWDEMTSDHTTSDTAGDLLADIPAAAAIADAVWDEPMALHTTSDTAGDYLTDIGAIPLSSSDVWAYGTRTLTQTAASVAAAIDGTSITCRRGDTLSASLTGLGDLVNWACLYFTVKDAEAEADSAALVQISLTTDGLLDDLLYLNGTTDSASSDGYLTLDSSSDGNITITLNADVSKLLPLGVYNYDVQIVRSSGTPVSTLTVGKFIVALDYTRATT